MINQWCHHSCSPSLQVFILSPLSILIFFSLESCGIRRDHDNATFTSDGGSIHHRWPPPSSPPPGVHPPPSSFSSSLCLYVWTEEQPNAPRILKVVRSSGFVCLCFSPFSSLYYYKSTYFHHCRVLHVKRVAIFFSPASCLTNNSVADKLPCKWSDKNNKNRINFQACD